MAQKRDRLYALDTEAFARSEVSGVVTLWLRSVREPDRRHLLRLSREDVEALRAFLGEG